MVDVTIGVCCYGDHPILARRCINSILYRTQPGHMEGSGVRITDLRIGLNACCPETETYLRGIRARYPIGLYISKPNVMKDPLMRHTLYNETHPMTSSVFMWFDDDSYFRADHSYGDFWPKFKEAMADTDVLGALYHMPPSGQQLQYVNSMPWCTKKRKPGYRFSFPTGGWWCGRTDYLRRWDYPFPALKQAGDDVLLGELCSQTDARLRNWRYGVAINADIDGADAKSPRRGIPGAPLGHVYNGNSETINRALVPLDELVWTQSNTNTP